MFFLSATATSFKTLIPFLTETDSPVSADSSIFKSMVSKSLKSAGTLFPASKRTTSPGTISSVFTSICSLFLMTTTFGTTSFFNASNVFSALYS